MRPLDQKDKLKLIRTMLVSRLGDLREQSLIRQGRGWFHVSGMGHEALSVIGYLLRDGDYLAGYYRDRPMALARGMSNYDLALAFYAKRTSASGGRQMPAHYSNRKLGIFSVASVVGSSLVPACGIAWGLQLDKKPNLVVTTIGDAGTRQGDFYEAVAFACERNLPVLFVVEDNGIGISTPTGHMTPLGLKVIDDARWHQVDGCDVDKVYEAVRPAMDSIRAGEGPQFLWCRTERISSHSSADDHRKYRSEDELASLDEKDPINRLKRQLIDEGVLTNDSFRELYEKLEKEVKSDYARAEQELDPDPADWDQHIFGPPANPPHLGLELPDKPRMVDAINGTFHAALDSSSDFVFFGQDIEDPKGGVFSLTKGLSSRHPDNVFNSPLAESTIIGVAVGLAAYGKRPVFEIQFTDFIWPAYNQIATHLSTLHWRTNGEWSAPAVIYAPYGAYLPGGALWHSQTNEAILAHLPGIQIAIPSSTEDAAGLFWTAMHSNSPSIVLVPKHLMWHPSELNGGVTPVPFGKARIRRKGDDLTIVTWGNGTEVVAKALESFNADASVEVIDLRSIQPVDYATIERSVARTRRLLVVQEDAEFCSVGQAIVSRIGGNPEIFAQLVAAPRLIAKPNVNIGYNPALEYATLPDAREVAAAIRDLIGTATSRQLAAQAPASRTEAATPNPAVQALKGSMHEDDHAPATTTRPLKVPILGEGITSARVIRMIAEPGSEIEQDDDLCEIETDKALFPIEAPFAGRLKEWYISEGDEIEVDQLIALVEVEETADAESVPRRVQAPAEPEPRPAVAAENFRPSEGGLPPHVVSQLKNVVPAHMSVKAAWAPISKARAQVKKQLGKDAPTPTVMVAWSLVQAMKKHRIFSCTINSNDTLTEHRSFDFGVAVALENDALDTAVIHDAASLDWTGFCEKYREAVRRVRSGEAVSKAKTPLILTSLGGFGVRDAQPVVVPPAIGTLFLGEAYAEPTGETTRDMVSLCLSFDHRWLNGLAGAQFLEEVRRQMEHFTVPVSTSSES